jgi:hypothetical protein
MVILDILNSILNLHPKEEKFIHIYLGISETLIICNSKDKLSFSDNFHTFFSN